MNCSQTNANDSNQHPRRKNSKIETANSSENCELAIQAHCFQNNNTTSMHNLSLSPSVNLNAEGDFQIGVQAPCDQLLWLAVLCIRNLSWVPTAIHTSPYLSGRLWSEQLKSENEIASLRVLGLQSHQL